MAVKMPLQFGASIEQMASGTLLDISVGGLFLATDELCAPGTELYLEFRLNPEKAPIACRGRVSWVNREGSLRDYASVGMGIEFIDIKKLDILSLQAFVRNHPSAD